MVKVVKITEHDGREREFKVTIKFAAKKDLHYLKQFLSGRHPDIPQETIQALDVVLRQSAAIDREVVGRSLFSPQFGKGVLGDGIEFWKGFYQSLRPTQMGLSLNIDMSARAFYEPKLVSDFIGDFLNKDLSRPFTDQDRIKVSASVELFTNRMQKGVLLFEVAEISRARIQGKEALINNCKRMDYSYGSEEDMPVWFEPARDGSGEVGLRMFRVGQCS